MNDTPGQERDEAAEDRERLALYGLSSVSRSDLTVSEGDCTTVTLRGSGADRYKKVARYAPVKSADDLKRMIGVPNEVARHRCRCPDELTAAFPPGFEKIDDLSPWQRDILRAATDVYVHGDSDLVSHFAGAIAHGLALSDKARISVVLFSDIIVERDAVLSVAPSVDVLFASKVLIKHGGKIRLTSRLKIDCSSIEGEEGFVIFNPIDIEASAGTLARKATP